MADWGGEECEGDKVLQEHRLGEKSQLDDTLIVFLYLFLHRNGEIHCSWRL